jgi:plastocyanin
MSMRTPFLLVAAVTVSGLVACGGGEAPKPAPSADASKAAAPAAAGTASIKGKIAFEGAPPAAEKVKLSADAKCEAMHKEGLEKQPVKVKDGGLADVLVYVKSGVTGDFPAPAAAVLLDQKGCTYTPHVVAVRVGQPITNKNSDDTLHNIHAHPTENGEFNIGQARQGMEATQTFDKPELKIPVQCDVHPWMRSYIHVLTHPFFAVSAEDGTFEIKGPPAGEYEVEALHPKLEAVTAKVTVKDGEAVTQDITVKG